MSEVEELANKYFEEQCEHTYADTLEELREDVVAAFLQGYAKGETDEKFRTKQVVTKDMAELKAQIEKMKCCENCKHHRFWGNDLGCNLMYDIETECLKTKNKWELWEEK